MSTKTKAAGPPRAQDLTYAEKQAILRSVPCKCGAQPGKRCISAGGHGIGTIHAARFAAASAAGKVRW